jgi:hypothetical protein
MVNLATLQDKINTKLSDNRTKEQKLHSLALNRLSSLYKEQSDSIDDIIDNISKSIDMEDIDYTYKLIKKLSRVVNSNRKQLINLLKEVT